MNAKAERPPIEEQFKRRWNKAIRNRNAAETLYYQRCFASCIAAVSFDRFIDSWAGQLWLEKNKDEISVIEADYKRFSYLH